MSLGARGKGREEFAKLSCTAVRRSPLTGDRNNSGRLWVLGRKPRRSECDELKV